MPPRKSRSKQPPEASVTDYRHSDKRKNIPPAGLAGQGKVQETPKTRYFYDPHLPPVLRFDESGDSDRLPELLEIARQRPLSEEEAALLAEALKIRQPWLEWAGKREKAWFDVDPVALHIHERVSAQAILKLASRQPIQRSFFADPELEYREAVQFYKHEMDWSNRLILGDSLTVMHSLAKREDLAGKVQMIYIDPPYGIKFASNFQSQIGKRDVKDKDSDLTREPEQIKAYRDTWTLGVHSYLAYLRERFIVSKELLADTGSIFVQISDENVHHVRKLLDEVFGADNFVGSIVYKTAIGMTAREIDNVFDYVIWYARGKSKIKFNRLFIPTTIGKEGATRYKWIEYPNGDARIMTREEYDDPSKIPENWRAFRDQGLTSRTGSPTTTIPFSFQEKTYRPSSGGWRTNENGLNRLALANRILVTGNNLSYKKFYDDFAALAITNFWSDTGGGITSRSDPKIYVVQTSNTIIARCLLMTTDPGDLVLDPTCGSGTTAYVAEHWGRRWITIDTSRVALALARQRLLTAKYDYYELEQEPAGPAGGFIYKTVPHITLKSIAQNQALDPVFARWEPVLDEKLTVLISALQAVTPELRARLQAKFSEKERREGKKSITDADRRRWILPKGQWEHWETPFDSDVDWPEALQQALQEYRQAWRGKMDEVNSVIAASAPQETLVDQPRIKPGVLRVSGPFTVEGVQPVEESLELERPIGGEPAELVAFNAAQDEPANAGAYLEKMIRLLKQDGVRFPNNKTLHFSRLEPLSHTVLHAEGEWGGGFHVPNTVPFEIPESRRVAVRFGPQYGPITAQQVEEAIWAASRGGYEDLVFAGFSIDGAAQAIIQDDPNPRVHCHLAHIRPDVNMGDLLKTTPSSQLFTVFGLPRVELTCLPSGEWVVEMQGVDITIRSITPSNPLSPIRSRPGSWTATTMGVPSASRRPSSLTAQPGRSSPGLSNLWLTRNALRPSRGPNHCHSQEGCTTALRLR
jgi:adenine-specific DNA-methyltransferase